jgi:hypothetical protein
VTLRRLPGPLRAVLAALASALIVAPSAGAADAQPCRPATQHPSFGAVQICPLWMPPRGSIPVHALDGGRATEAGRLLEAGTANWFVCQSARVGGRAIRYRDPGTPQYTNVWWARTLSDTGAWGWTSEVYFQGGADDERDGGLRECTPAEAAVTGAAAPPPGSPPPAPPAPSGPPIGVGGSGGGSVPPAALSCRRFEVIGARGSGETLSGPYAMGDTVGATAASLIAALPGSVRATSVRYPAAPVEALAQGNGDGFFLSIAAGKNALLRRLLQLGRDCPDTRVALIGYSQGAAVVSEALRQALDRDRRRVNRVVRAVVLFADPWSAGEGSGYDITLTRPGARGASRIGHGSLGARRLPAYLRSRVADVCYAGDLVCDTAKPTALALYQAFLLPVHTSYKSCCAGAPLTRLQGRRAARLLLG